MSHFVYEIDQQGFALLLLDPLEMAVAVAGEVEIVGSGESELTLLEPGVGIALMAPAFHSARLMLMGDEPFPTSAQLLELVFSSAERIEQAKDCAKAVSPESRARKNSLLCRRN